MSRSVFRRAAGKALTAFTIRLSMTAGLCPCTIGKAGSRDMKVQKLFQRTLFGIFILFGVIGVSTTMALHLYGRYPIVGGV